MYEILEGKIIGGFKLRCEKNRIYQTRENNKALNAIFMVSLINHFS